MKKSEFLKYLCSEGWRKRWVNDEDEWEYERSYRDFLYDNLYIIDDSVNVTYNEIGWGYTNFISYEFSFEEFIEWWKGLD